MIFNVTISFHYVDMISPWTGSSTVRIEATDHLDAQEKAAELCSRLSKTVSCPLTYSVRKSRKQAPA